MSWQKCMPFSKCSDLEAKSIMHFKLCHQRNEGSNYNLQQTKFRKQNFLNGFYASESQSKRKIQVENKTHQGNNLKISSIQAMQNLFTLQTLFKVLKSIHWLWRPFPTLYSKENTKNG